MADSYLIDVSEVPQHLSLAIRESTYDGLEMKR